MHSKQQLVRIGRERVRENCCSDFAVDLIVGGAPEVPHAPSPWRTVTSQCPRRVPADKAMSCVTGCDAVRLDRAGCRDGESRPCRRRALWPSPQPSLRGRRRNRSALQQPSWTLNGLFQPDGMTLRCPHGSGRGKHPVKHCKQKKMEAPPGFEPGMEVLQSGRPVTRFMRKQAQIERLQSHANRSLYAPVRRNGQQHAPHGTNNGITLAAHVGCDHHTAESATTPSRTPDVGRLSIARRYLCIY